MRPLILLLAAAATTFLAADTAGAEKEATALSETPEAFSEALNAWAVRHKVTRAVIVVRRDGRIVHRGQIGGADPDQPVLLASLSKAITAACVATLVRDGKLGFDWPLSKALAGFFLANGRPAEARIEQITIGELITHRAGFQSAADGEDPSTRSVLNAYLASHSSREPPRPAYLAMMLRLPLKRDPGRAFAYSNAGYLALGAVVEEATGQGYESHCRDAVLRPAGAGGRLDPVWAVMGAYGGWHMTGADYLAFLEQLDPRQAHFGAEAQRWMLDRTGKSTGPEGGGWYGLGVRVREQGGGHMVWHTGSWRRKLGADKIGPRSIETSTLAVRLPDGTSWFVHSLPLVLDGARVELMRELMKAHAAVRRWP
jgi:CubicO group peptidase (beta-lactamase class C family)